MANNLPSIASEMFLFFNSSSSEEMSSVSQDFLRVPVRELLSDSLCRAIAASFSTLRLDDAGDERASQRHRRWRIEFAVAITKIPRVRRIGLGGRSSIAAASNKPTMAIASAAELRFPDYIGDVLCAMCRILSDPARTFDERFSIGSGIGVIRGKRRSNRSVCRPDSPLLLDVYFFIADDCHPANC